MFKSAKDWKKEFEKKNALWIHGGDPKQKHVILTSGNHSNGFFYSTSIVEDYVLLNDAVSDLLFVFAKNLFKDVGRELGFVDAVVGPAKGATKIAKCICEQVNAYTRGECFYASPTKALLHGKKIFEFENKDKEYLPSQNVLLCEDVVSTGGSVGLVAEAINRAGGKVLPYVLTLVNRSGLDVIGGRKIIALINHEMPIWTPAKCVLCKQGSKAIRPKGDENWAKLMA